MNIPSNAVPESPLEPQAAAPTSGSATTRTRPFYWSVRRELWENRSIYVAPLVVAALVLLASLISAIDLPERRRALMLLDPAQQQALAEKPYDLAATLIILTAILVGVFYCLDALHGERRDRSILFWKSLPVSDLTTVLSKASIPLLVLPPLTFAIVMATQLIMLLLSMAVVLTHGLSVVTWTPLSSKSLMPLYGLIALALWYAPIYAWLLLVSGWARRTTFLWAVLAPLVLCVVERIAFGTWHLAALLKYRLIGFATEAFAFGAHGSIDSLAQLTPGRFFSAPGLWIGLAFAAALLAAAARLRRYRGPI